MQDNYEEAANILKKAQDQFTKISNFLCDVEGIGPGCCSMQGVRRVDLVVDFFFFFTLLLGRVGIPTLSIYNR
jgi:hypothetical protein